MKLIITGDWQLDSNPAYDKVNPLTNRSTRFDENVETIERMLDDGMAKGADGLLHLGDLTENRDPKAIEMAAAARLFEHVLRKDRRVWGVAGNHDGSFFEVSSSSFAPLAAMRPDQFTLFHKVTYDPGLRMLAVPYIHRATPAEIRALVESAYPEDIGHGPVFGAVHYGLRGCTVGARNQVLPGDYLGPDELLARPLDHVFAGHIHKAQEVDLNGVPGWHPGSPIICDMGERVDRKTYLLFDTISRKVEVFDVPKRRNWVSVVYGPDISNKTPEWGPEDLLRVTGTYEKPDYPKGTLEAAFKAGLPRPFALEVEVKSAKVERALRSLSVTSAGGLREALQTYVREKYPRQSDTPGPIGPATELALAALQEQGGLSYCSQIYPSEISISNFMTFAKLTRQFATGDPMLIAGENGVGKTNFFEAILWALTGRTSKGLDLAGVVRQGTQEAEVIMGLLGSNDDEEDQHFRISRSVKLSKAGKPSQRLTLERMHPVTLAWDKTLSDGSQAEIQGRIDGLVGGSFLTLRTTNFKFQKDNSPFIACHPTERKAVIGEVTGLAPLGRAFKALDAKRLESARAFQAGKDRLSGMVVAGEGNDSQIAQYRHDEEIVSAEMEAARAEAPLAEAVVEAANEASRKAKSEAMEIETQYREQPNTEAIAKASAQAHATFEAAYQSGRAEKVKSHGALKASIASAMAELTETKVPTKDELQVLEANSAALTGARESLRSEMALARNDLSTVEVRASALGAAVATHGVALRNAEHELHALGEIQAEAEVIAARDMAEAEAAESVEAYNLALQECVTVREAAKALADRAASLLAEKSAFSGKDVGACSRCGQAIDSTHMLMEIARIDGEIEANALLIQEVATKTKEANTAFIASTARKTTAQENAKKASEAFHSLKLKTQLHQSMTVKAQDLKNSLATAEAEHAKKKSESENLVRVVARVYAELASSEAQVAKAILEATTARASVQKAESTRGRLEALNAQLEELTAAGIRERAEYEAEIVRLIVVAEEAKLAHDGQVILLSILREKMEAARLAVEAANTNLTTVTLALHALRTRISVAEQRAESIKTAIARLVSQQSTLVEARFELGLMKERSEIDECAAGLLDARSGLPVYLIDQALPFLEDRINYYLTMLGMERLVVQLSTLAEDKETLAVLIDNGRPGPRLDVAAYSGGQLDRVEYGVKCALADLARQSRGVTFGLVCFDEPSGGLNAAGKDALISLLYERCSAYPVTILTSHDEALIRAFHNQIRFGQGPDEETIVLGEQVGLEIKENLVKEMAAVD